MASIAIEVEPEVIGHEEDLSNEHPSEEAEEEPGIPSEKSHPRLAHARRKVTEEPHVPSSEDEETAHLVSGHARHKETEEHGKMTAVQAASNLVTCMVGASVLSLPRMVANNGWALGPLMVVLAGLVSYQACVLVDQAMEAIAEIHGQHPKNIGDVVQECFGLRGKRAVLFLTCVFQISKCGVYFVVIGTNLNYAMETVSLRAWSVTGAMICMRLIFVRDITVISQWSFIGVLASFVYLLTISAGGIEAAATRHTVTKLWPSTYSNLLADFAVMVYAYSPIDVLPVMKHDMKEPRQLCWSLRVAFMVVILIYVSLGSVAVLGWGDRLTGNVLLSMCEPPGCPGQLPAGTVPGKKWLLGYCLACAVVSNLMVTAPVVLYCVFRVLEAENPHLLANGLVNRAARIITVLGALMIALFMPFFTEILAVISTGLLSLLQVFVPVAVTLALHLRRSTGGFVCFLREMMLTLLGLGMLTSGMSSALRNLYRAIHHM
ncbi:unnamed protein product [Effrenium voratum]|nr:unnamed protein product [Effrenium voratum]